MSNRSQFLRQQLKRVVGLAPSAQQPLPKHLKMAQSPLRFLRGTVQRFYADLALGKLSLPSDLMATIPLTTMMSDCHLSNFGFFTAEGSHGDKVIFAPNDFDDACIGHCAWDLLRVEQTAVNQLPGAIEPLCQLAEIPYLQTLEHHQPLRQLLGIQP